MNLTLQTSPQRIHRQPLRWQTVAGWLLLAAPILLLARVWSLYAINIPKWDDHALRYFLYLFDKESTFAGRVYQLFKQHNEHRIVYDRIVTWLDYNLFGKLSYLHLMMVGNLSLLGLVLVFMAAVRRTVSHSRAVWLAAPVAWLLCNLSQWENLFWGMAALQNFSVVLWVLATVYWLSFTRRWGMALALGVLATLTSGNGLLIWPIGFLILLLQTPTITHRRYVPLLSWSVGAAVVIALYFTGFERPGGAYAVQPGPVALLKGWCAVMGAAGEVIPVGAPLKVSMLLGALLIATSLSVAFWNVWRYWPTLLRTLKLLTRRHNTSSVGSIPPMVLFYWGSLVFLLGTGAVVASARAGFGPELLITSRYKMYSLTLLALLYVYLVTTLPRRLRMPMNVVGLLGGVALTWLSYYSFQNETQWWRHWLTTNQFNWTRYRNGIPPQQDSVTYFYTDLAPAFYDTKLPALYAPATERPLTLTRTQNGKYYTFTEKTLVAPGEVDAGAYLMARSASRTYIFPTARNQNAPMRPILIPDNPFTAGFSGVIDNNELAIDTYRILVMTVSPTGTVRLHPTNQTITAVPPIGKDAGKNW